MEWIPLLDCYDYQSTCGAKNHHYHYHYKGDVNSIITITASPPLQFHSDAAYPQTIVVLLVDRDDNVIDDNADGDDDDGDVDQNDDDNDDGDNAVHPPPI